MPETTIPEGLVPARYIGHGSVTLKAGGTYYNIDGTRRTKTMLDPGDELLMRDEDILGKTLLFDPRGVNPPLLLGLGRVVLPEHAELSDQERAHIGYEHHVGRADFEAIEPLKHDSKKRARAKEAPQTIMLEEPQAESE